MRSQLPPKAGNFSSDHEGRGYAPLLRKPCDDNRRSINPNFLFFFQVVLLIVPIAVLYAGLYFMNVSSPVIVIICGAIIFFLLCCVIFIRPFSPPEIKRAEDTVPLTRSMSPPGKYQYKTEPGETEEPSYTYQQEPNGYRSVPKLSQAVPQKSNHQHTKHDYGEECVCPTNPTPHGTAHSLSLTNALINHMDSSEYSHTSSDDSEEDDLCRSSRGCKSTSCSGTRAKKWSLAHSEPNRPRQLFDVTEMDLLNDNEIDVSRHVHFTGLGSIEEEEEVLFSQVEPRLVKTTSYETCCSPTSPQQQSKMGKFNQDRDSKVCKRTPSKRRFPECCSDSVSCRTSTVKHEDLDDEVTQRSCKIPRLVDCGTSPMSRSSSPQKTTESLSRQGYMQNRVNLEMRGELPFNSCTGRYASVWHNVSQKLIDTGTCPMSRSPSPQKTPKPTFRQGQQNLVNLDMRGMQSLNELPYGSCTDINASIQQAVFPKLIDRGTCPISCSPSPQKSSTRLRLDSQQSHVNFDTRGIRSCEELPYSPCTDRNSSIQQAVFPKLPETGTWFISRSQTPQTTLSRQASQENSFAVESQGMQSFNEGPIPSSPCTNRYTSNQPIMPSLINTATSPISRSSPKNTHPCTFMQASPENISTVEVQGGIQSHKTGKRPYTPCTDNTSNKPILITLFPTSSKEGVFEWGKAGKSGNTFNIFSYNYKPIDLTSQSKITVGESSQSAIASNITLKLGSNHESKSAIEEKIGCPEPTKGALGSDETKPKSVLYIVNEKAPPHESISRITNGESSNRASPSDPVESAAKSSAKKTEVQEDNAESLQVLAPSRNESILDFVLRRSCYDRQHNGSNTDDRSKCNVSTTHSLSNSNVNARNGANKGVATSEKATFETTIEPSPWATSRSTLSREKTHSSPDLLKTDCAKSQTKYDLQFLGKDKSHSGSPKLAKIWVDLKSDLLNSLDLSSSIFFGAKNKQFEPIKSGLLATESSKEEVNDRVQRKIVRSPRMKKKTKSRPMMRRDDYLRKPIESKRERCVAWCKVLPLAVESLNRELQQPNVSSTIGGVTKIIQAREKSEIQNYSKFNMSNTVNSAEGKCVGMRHPVKSLSPRSCQYTKKDREVSQKDNHPKKEPDEVKGRRSSFPPFNLDFSSSGHEEDSKKRPSVPSKVEQKEPLQDRKGFLAKDSDKIKRRAKDGAVLVADAARDKGGSGDPGSPVKNKNRRISHRVESTLFKKSSSSYENVIIERVIKQKKRTLKKFK